jgi:hypothetical protein
MNNSRRWVLSGTADIPSSGVSYLQKQRTSLEMTKVPQPLKEQSTGLKQPKVAGKNVSLRAYFGIYIHDCLLWLTPLSWALLEKPPVAQLLNKSSLFLESEGSVMCSQEPSLLLILSLINPLQTTSSFFLKISVTIMFLSMSRSS